MTIWAYTNTVRDVELVRAAVLVHKCIFCQAHLETPRWKTTELKWTPPEHNRFRSGPFSYTRPAEPHASPVSDTQIVRCCPVCGWWTKQVFSSVWFSSGYQHRHFGAAGSLRELDLSDQSIPLKQIRSYLAAKESVRFRLDPWRFEETVASVYRDLGFQARVTSRSGDGGIDVILDGPRGEVIGVQVKRYKAKIKVEQIRSLAGALMLDGKTRGMFVTTSEFQRGARSTVAKYRRRGTAIEQALQAPEHL